MKILIFGKGQMGEAYKEYFSGRENTEVVLEGSVDITDAEAVKKTVKENGPQVVINCAGKTNLDWCEVHRLECFNVNVLGADNVGAACQEAGIYLVHLSSGCVQESLTDSEVHKETDTPHPLAFYSWTKVWGENLLTERALRHNLKVLILRGRQLVSAKASPRNALTKLITYSKFIDTPNSMTVVEDMVDVTRQLIDQNITGVINIANPGIMTPYNLAVLLKEIVRPDMQVSKISKEELNKMTFATRVDCVLDTSKLEGLGITMEAIEPRLRRLLPVFKDNLSRDSEVLAVTQKETDEKLSLKKV